MFTIRLPWPDTSVLLSAPLRRRSIRSCSFGLVAAAGRRAHPPAAAPLPLRTAPRAAPQRHGPARRCGCSCFAIVLMLLCASADLRPRPAYRRCPAASSSSSIAPPASTCPTRSASRPTSSASPAPWAWRRTWTRSSSSSGSTITRRTAPSAGCCPARARSDREPLADKRMKQHDDLCKQIDELTRAAIARRILDQDGLDVLGRLGSKHKVELYAIDREVSELTAEQLADAPGRRQEGRRRRLHRPARCRWSAPWSAPGRTGKILGVVLLTDGQHNSGRPPGEKARELGERGIPVFPVALGEKKSPPDVAVVSVRGPNHTVFKDVDAAVEVRFKVAGMQAAGVPRRGSPRGQGRSCSLRRRSTTTATDRYYVESFPIRLDEVGTQTVTATVKPVPPDAGPKETVADNNSPLDDDRRRRRPGQGAARRWRGALGVPLPGQRPSQRDRLVQLKTRRLRPAAHRRPAQPRRNWRSSARRGASGRTGPTRWRATSASSWATWTPSSCRSTEREQAGAVRRRRAAAR